MCAALWFAPAHPLGRLLAALGSLGVGAWGAAPILFGNGRRAVRGWVWETDGTWRLRLPDGAWQPARLIPATATLGPWILLVWQGPRRRHYALIDVWECGVPAFRSLRGRLKLEAGASQPPISG